MAPRHESSLFRNRDKFDLVVMYDESSESFGPSISPMSIAVRIVYENAFQKMLKKPPVILVGGVTAWKNTYPSEIAHENIGSTDADADRASPGATSSSLSASPHLQNGTHDLDHLDQTQKEPLPSSSVHTGIEHIARNTSNGQVAHDVRYVLKSS